MSNELTTIEAIKDMFRRYIDFYGCSSRKQFICGFFFVKISFLILVIQKYQNPGIIINYVCLIWYLATIIPLLALTTRRIRCMGWSQWSWLLFIIPFINILFLLALCIMPNKEIVTSKEKIYTKFEWNLETTGHTVSDKKICFFPVVCGIIFLFSIIYAERYEYANKNAIDVSDQWEQITPESIENMILRGNLNVKGRDKDGKTPLMYAAEFNQDPKVIEVLIKNGADVNTRNQEGMTALMYAVSDNNNSEIVRTLIKYGAEVNARHPNGDSVLIGASKLCQNPKVIEVLLKNGANIKLKNKNGTNALMGAALFNKNPDIIDVLIKYGADIKGRDDYGFTVLMLAAGKNENPEVIKRLIKYGAPISVDLNGRTVLDYAKLNSKIYGTDVYWLLNDLMYK